MGELLTKEVLDPKGSRTASSGKISLGVLKFYLGAGGARGGEPALVAAPQGQIDSSSRDASKGDDAGPRLSAEAIQTCKRAARKVLL